MTRFSSFLEENNPGGSSDSDRAGENGTLPLVSGGAVPFIDLGKMGGLSGGGEGGKK